MTSQMPEGARVPISDELRNELLTLLDAIPVRSTPQYAWRSAQGEAFLARVVQAINDRHPSAWIARELGLHNTTLHSAISYYTRFNTKRGLKRSRTKTAARPTVDE